MTQTWHTIPYKMCRSEKEKGKEQVAFIFVNRERKLQKGVERKEELPELVNVKEVRFHFLSSE